MTHKSRSKFAFLFPLVQFLSLCLFTRILNDLAFIVNYSVAINTYVSEVKRRI